MKKSLIALAVAGAFAAPTANAIEFTPTMYQSVAISFGSDETGGVENGSTSGDVAAAPQGQTLVQGGGRSIGFKASDDLGNGMTATAFIHWTTDNTEGHSAGPVNRNGYVGLSGNFGSVKLGTAENVYEVGMIIDGWGSDWAGGNSVGGWDGAATRIGGAGAGFGFNWTRQDNNNISWTSPNWGGVVVDVAYIMGPGSTGGATSKDASGVQAAVSWSNGPLSISGALASYSEYEAAANDMGDFTGATSATSDATSVDADGQRLTVQYDFGVAYVGGTVNFLKEKVPGTEVKVTTYALTGKFPVATGRIIANYVMSGEQDVNGTTISDSDGTGFDIGYQHDLSANTYAFARYQMNEVGTNYGTIGGGKHEYDAMMVGLKVSY
jgi:predicted porin